MTSNVSQDLMGYLHHLRVNFQNNIPQRAVTGQP